MTNVQSKPHHCLWTDLGQDGHLGNLTREVKERCSGNELFGNVSEARIISNVCLTEAFANRSSIFFFLFAELTGLFIVSYKKQKEVN